MTAEKTFCFRVWMKDGYAGLYNAATADEAKGAAIAYAKKSIEGAAMSATEKTRAVTVDHLENLTEEQS